MPLPGESVEPLTVTVVDASVSHDNDPPVIVDGSVGAVRSILAVLAALAVVGVHAEVLPALSILRNWSSVVPSSVTVADAPEDGVVQIVPLVVELRYW